MVYLCLITKLVSHLRVTYGSELPNLLLLTMTCLSCVLAYLLRHLVPCQSRYYCVSTQHQECHIVVVVVIGPSDVVDSTNRQQVTTDFPLQIIRAINDGGTLLPSATWSRGKQLLNTSQVCKQEGDLH
jgi:hypothetical protein